MVVGLTLLVLGHVIGGVQSEKREVAITPQILVPVGVVLPSAKIGRTTHGSAAALLW